MGLFSQFDDPTQIAAAAAIPILLALYSHPRVGARVQQIACMLAYAGAVALMYFRGAYVAAAVSLLFFLGVEAWRARRFLDIWNSEAFLNLIYIFALMVVAEPVAAEIGRFVSGVILEYQGYGWGLQSTELPLVIQGVILFVAYDFRRYWTHRLEHNIGVLWRIHKHHHSPRQMTLLAATRDHPFYPFEEAVLATATILVVGPEPAVIFPSMAAYFSLVKINHVGVDFPRLTPDRPMPWWAFVISTPTFHAWHHTTNCRYDANLADNLPIWDVLFGTYQRPEPDRSQWKYGLVAAEQLPDGFLHSMLTPVTARQAPDRERETLSARA
jgi:sterol desaturase/sphingolipid hydroxylase (fatty acid hydroxylase superfamily)